MPNQRHFDITTLPLLGDLGSTPPMGLADLIEHVGENGCWREQIEAIVLLDDLTQRDAMLVGEMDEPEPAVLSDQQTRGEAPLPSRLFDTGESEKSRTTAQGDVLWERYFRYVHELGQSQGSSFLMEWATYEVSLRNAIASARARRLGLDESAYSVAPDLADTDEDLSPVVSEWETATTPLAGLRVLIRARWDWVERHDAWFSFSVDEILAYAVRIMLLEQWRRTAEQDDDVGA